MFAPLPRATAHHGLRRLALLLAAATLFVITLLCPSSARAQIARKWESTYNGEFEGAFDEPYDVAADAQGNVYVVGYSEAIGTNTDDNFSDYGIVKYNAQGQVVWARRFDEPGDSYDVAHAVALDASGNVYVTGESDTYPGYGPYDTMTTVKYTSSGVFQWAARHEAPGTSVAEGHDVAVDSAGNVFACGEYSDGTGVVIKYNASGVQQWLRARAGYGTKLAVDKQNNVAVIGVVNDFEDQQDGLVEKYNGATGAVLWSKVFKGPSNEDDYVNAVAVDPNGDVLVAGVLAYNDTDEDMYVAKYSGANGTVLWDYRFYGDDGSDSDYRLEQRDAAHDVKTDAQGNVFITGTAQRGGERGFDAITIKLDGAGNKIWTASFNSDVYDSDSGDYLALDERGDVYVTAIAAGSFTSSGFATVKYDNATGAEMWRVIEEEKSIVPSLGGITVNKEGDVFIVGSHYPGSDYITIKYSPTFGYDARAVAVGADNKTRLLWTRADGSVALWMVNAAGVIEAGKTYAAPAGYVPQTLTVGNDNKTRLLWHSPSTGKAAVWTISPNLATLEAGALFGPVAGGYVPRAITAGPSASGAAAPTKTRLAWNQIANNRAGIWTIHPLSAVESAAGFGAYTNLSLQGLAVGANGKTRALWRNAATGAVAAWTLNAAGTALESGKTWAQPSGYSLGGFGVGGDNKFRLLWRDAAPSGPLAATRVALWRLSPDNQTIEAGKVFGPLAGTQSALIAVGPADNKTRLIWKYANGKIALWTLNAGETAVESGKFYGPLP